MSMTVEYPDPVVASFLSRVRLLAAEPDEPSWAERRRRVVQADGWKRRVLKRGLTFESGRRLDLRVDASWTETWSPTPSPRGESR